MATQLGNTTKNYGQKHNYVVTNLNGEAIIKSSDLLENTFIVSSPTDVSKTDLTFEDPKTGERFNINSIFATDSNGNPVRLTHTIQPGRGLVVGRNGKPEKTGDGIDVISMAIDDYSIRTHPTSQYLYVQCYNIIDNYTLTTNPYGLVGDYMSVVTANLDKATNDSWGVVRSRDPRTAVQIDKGELSIITEKLDYVDDDLNVNGIVRCQSDAAADLGFRTVEAQNGRLHVITKNLDKPTKSYCGVVKADEFIEPDSNGVGGQVKTTTILRDGSIHVVNYTYTYSYITTEGLTYQGHGIVAPDNKTTITEKPGIMSVDTAGLVHASEKEYGTVKVDGDSTLIDSKGLLTVGYWGKITAVLRDFNPSIQKIWDKLAEYENRIAWLEAQAMAEKIYSFVSTSGNMTVLTEPVWETNLNSETRNELFVRSGEAGNYTYTSITGSTTPYDVSALDPSLIYYVKLEGNGVIPDTYIPAKRAATFEDYTASGNSYNYIISGGITSVDQEFSVEFAVSTNCMFKVSVEYEDNVNPAVTLQSVKFQTDIDVAASGLTEFTFDSTDGNEQTLKFSFRARNYNSDTSESETVTRVTFLVTSTNNSTIYKKGTHAFKRFNEKAYTQENGGLIPEPDPVYPKDPTDWQVDYITGIELVTTDETSTGDDGVSPNYMTPVPYGTIGSFDIPFNAYGIHHRTTYVDSTDETGTPETSEDPMIVENPVIDYNLNDGLELGQIGVTVEYFKPRALIQAALAVKSVNGLVAKKFNAPNNSTYYQILTDTTFASKTSAASAVCGETLSVAPRSGAIQDITTPLYSGVSDVPLATSEFSVPTSSTSLANIVGNEINTYVDTYAMFNAKKVGGSSNTSTFETFMPIQTTYTQGTTAGINARSMITKELPFTSVSEWIADSGANWLNASITTTYEQTGTYTLLHLQSNGAIIDDRCAKVTLQYVTIENGVEVTKSKSFYYTEQYVENKPNLSVTANLNNIGDPLTFTLTRSPNSRLTGECYDENGNPVAQYWGATVTFNYVANLSRKNRINNLTDTLYGTDDIEALNYADILANGTQSHSGNTIDAGTTFTGATTGGRGIRGTKTMTKGNGSSLPTAYMPAVSFVSLASHTIYLQGNRSENSITFTYQMSASDEAIRGTDSLSSVVITYVSTESFTYAGGPNITYSTNGSWNASQAGIMSSSYTFGNAKIQNVTINKWDDAEMLITFDIKPGTTTNIPSNMRSGTVISEILMSDHGSRDFKFMIGNSTYDWDCFYTHCTFSATPWTTYGCTVTYRLWNKVSSTQNAQTPFRKVVCTFRNSQGKFSEFNEVSNEFVSVASTATTSVVDRMYTDNDYSKLAAMPAFANRVNVTNLQLVNGPMLNAFNYIKFWFSLNAQWYTNMEQTVVGTVGTKFEVSLLTLSNKYGSATSSITYADGGVININLVNALYTSNSTSNNNIIGGGTVSLHDETFDDIINTISDLSDKYNTIQSGSAIRGGALNVNNNTEPIIGNGITGGSSSNSNNSSSGNLTRGTTQNSNAWQSTIGGGVAGGKLNRNL